MDDDDFDIEEIQEAMIDEYGNIMDWNAKMQRAATRAARKLLKMADNYDALAERCRDLAAVNVITAQQLSGQAHDLLVAEFDMEVVKADGDEDDEED